MCEGDPELLFCENETNSRRLYGTNAVGFFKDGISDYVVGGVLAAVNPDRLGTKAAALYRLTLPAEGLRRRLAPGTPGLADFDAAMRQRWTEANEFYDALQRDIADPTPNWYSVRRPAGMLWSKQLYCFDIPEWVRGDPLQPEPPRSRRQGRNGDRLHLNNADIVSMPDKWEYPWHAAWDLAFHCATLALVDLDFAKDQLLLLTRDWHMHRTGSCV